MNPTPVRPVTSWVIRKQIFPVLAVSFWVSVPFVTYILLWLKGFPSFAEHHLGAVLVWVYEMTWIPALPAGIVLSIVVLNVIQRTNYFHRPYDFGRCFSLGAIGGAVTQALATWVYRALTLHPFSDFWIAGALIAGCLTGAFLTAFFLRRAAVPRPV